MDIALVSPQSIRIKGKNSSFIANPIGIKTKTAADGILLLSKKEEADLAKVEEYRLVVRGAGEYEVSGSKVTASSSGDSLCYYIVLDNGTMCVTSSSYLSNKGKDAKECPILALYCDSDVDSAIIAEIAPRALVLFGGKAADVAKALGKEATKSSKFQATTDKLPEEMSVTILG